MYVSIRVGLLLYHRLASIYASLLKLSPVVPFPPQGCFLDSLLCKRYRVQWIREVEVTAQITTCHASLRWEGKPRLAQSDERSRATELCL